MTRLNPIRFLLFMAIMAASAPVSSGQDVSAVDSLYPETPLATESKKRVNDQDSAQVMTNITRLEKQVEKIEARLGPTARPSSIGYNIERRLADLERRVQQLEQKQARMLQWEQRIRRLEMR